MVNLGMDSYCFANIARTKVIVMMSETVHNAFGGLPSQQPSCAPDMGTAGSKKLFSRGILY